MLTLSALRPTHLGPDKLQPVTLDIEAGTCAAIMGPSGSGKSLILRAIADLDVSEGSVSLDGADRRSMTAPAWRSRVGYLAAEPGWWAETVAEHFLAWRETSETVRKLGFAEDCGDWPVQRLSTGERQRLGFARLLERNPRALLLDEPTSGLDQEAEESVEALIRGRLEAGNCALIVTHDEEQMHRLATRGYRLKDGRLHEVWRS